MGIPAFGLKYRIPYTTDQGTNREIRIFKDGYGAAPILWKGGRTPWSLSKGDTDDVFGNLIVSGVATIEVVIEYQLEITEFLEERQSHLVQWVDLDSENVLWSGWIEPYDGRKPYTEAPHYVTLKATCGLAQLKKIRYQHTINENPKKVTLAIIRNCLFLTGHSLNINTSLFTLALGMPAGSDPLAGYRLDTNRYLLSNGQRMYAYDILSDLMERHNCELFQENNEWIIRSIPDNARGYLSQKNYLPGGTFNLQRTPALDYEINSDKALSLKVGTVTALRPIKRWSAFADLLPYTNPIANGDLMNMDANGFVGWNLVPMFGQWSSFSTGKKERPNGLNINGAVYSVDIVRIKQNFWGKKTQQLREPARYVEVPPLTFNQWVTTTMLKVVYRLEVPFDRSSENINLLTAVWAERSDGTERVWLQRDGSWSSKWDVIATKGATPELDVAPSELKLEIPTAILNKRTIGSPFKAPYEVVHARIYQALVTAPNATDNQINVKIFSVSVAINEGVGLELPTSVSYSLQTDSTVEDENNQISLMTGEVSGAYLSGIMLQLNADTNTGGWRRAGYDERKTSIGSMITDRIAMTSLPLGTVQCSIKIKVGEDAADIFQFQNYLRFVDIDPLQRYKITRYSLDDLRGVITVNAIELKHADAAVVSGITRLGDSDATYDSTGDSTSDVPVIVPVADGSINPEDATDNARINFELLPTITFTAGVPDVKELNLLEFLFPEAEEEEDVPDLSGFSVLIYSKPDFINEIEIEGLVLTIDASPKTSGQYSIPYLISDPELGESSSGSIVVIVEPNEELVEAWPPVFDPPLPTLFFEVGKETTDGFQITDYMPEDLVYEHLSYRIMGKPEWVSDQSVVFGEVSVTGKPVKIETRYLTLEMTDAIGRIHVEEITLACIKKTVLKHTLIDLTSGSAVLGVIPGSYENPDKIGIESVITGFHDKIERVLTGGGPSGSSVNESSAVSVTETNLGTYQMFPDGFTAPVGQYKYVLRSFRGTRLVTEDTIPFTLYDQEYLSKLSVEIWDTDKDELIAVLEPDGSTILKKVANWNLKLIVAGNEHDHATATLSKDGGQYFTREYDQVPAISDFTYELFEEGETESSGAFELVFQSELSGEPTYNRVYAFTFAEEVVKPVAGITLGTYPANTLNFKEIQDLPLNNAEIDLPDNWSIKPSDESGVEYDYISGQLFQNVSGGLNEVNVALYTGLPSFISFAEPVTESNFLLFRDLNSTDIGSIHSAPSSFRAIFTKRLGGESGKIVEIDQADFVLRVPLTPDDYSGLRYITTNAGVITVLDANMPKAGRTYLLSTYPDIWSVSNLEFDGKLFDKIRSKAKINLGGGDVVLNMFGPDYILETTVPDPVSVLQGDIALMSGWPGPDHLRYCFAPDGSQIYIDQPCEIEITVEGYLSGILIASKTSRFTLAQEVENPPIKDCCGGGSEFPVYEDVAGTWGDEFKIPKFTLTENGTISDVENIDVVIPGDEIVDRVHNFDFAPKTLFPGTDLDNLATIGQVQDAVASGSADRTPVKTVATANVNLSGLQTISGYTLQSGDRVLLTAQTDAKQNGPYTAAAGAWVRSVDSDTGAKLLGATYLVTAGGAATIQTKWKVINPAPIVIGTTLIDIIQIQGAETDPTVPAWVKSITELQKSNWDIAYSVASNFNNLFDARFGDKNTNNLAEGSNNKYFTEARVRATPLTGLAIQNAFINQFDTVLSAFGKIQGQFDNTNTNLFGYVKKAEAAVISASHIFTGTELTMPSVHYSGLLGNAAYVHFYPVGFGGSASTSANLRVWDGAAGNHRDLSFSGSGAITWGGIGIVLATRAVNTGTGLLGGGDLSANRTLSVNFGTLAGTVAEGNHVHTFASLTSKPTTIAGYGITDAASLASLNGYVPITRSIVVGSGILGGGNLSQDRAISFDIAWGDARYITPSSSNNLTNKTGNISMWTNNAGYVTTDALSSALGNFVRKDIGAVITADHQFTSTSLTLSSIYSHNLLSNVAYVNYYPVGGNGVNNSSAQLRVWNAAGGAPISLSLNGNGSLQWNGAEIATRSWVTSYGFLTSASLNGYATESYVNSRGFITGISSAMITAALGYAPYNSFVNPNGYISGITAGMITAALGYTPYSSANPNGYITASSSNNLTNKTGYISMWANDSGYIRNADLNFSVIVSALGYTPYNGTNPNGYISGINGAMVTNALGYTPMRDDRMITFNGVTYNLRDNPNLGSFSGGISGSGPSSNLAVWGPGNTLTATSIYTSGGDLYLQTGGIAAGTANFASLLIKAFDGNIYTPSPSAAFEIVSTTKGFLLPRMTRAQRLAIPNPAPSLKVWQTDAVGSSAVGEKTHVGGGVWTANSVYFD